MPKPKLQPSPSTPKEPTSSLPMKPTPTLKMTGMLLMLTKKNPLGMVSVNLKGTKRLKRMKNLPPSSSSVFFFFLFFRENGIYSFYHPLFLGFFGCKHFPFMGFFIKCYFFCPLLEYILYIYPTINLDVSVLYYWTRLLVDLVLDSSIQGFDTISRGELVP